MLRGVSSLNDAVVKEGLVESLSKKAGLGFSSAPLTLLPPIVVPLTLDPLFPICRPSSLSKRLLNISLANGAPFMSGEYSAIGGTETIRFVNTEISIFGCTMVTFMLNGAIS